jgi:hypothetical protein
MTYAAKVYDNMEIKTHDTIYGTIRRLKLTPAARMEIISELPAIFDVKNMTAMKTNNGEKRFAKYGMKLR